jgi:hypothetical protein
MTDQTPKRTRRSSEEVQAERDKKELAKAQELEAMSPGKSDTLRVSDHEVRSTIRDDRPEIRQKTSKPLKLDVSVIKRELERQLNKQIQMKWVRHDAVSHGQEIGWIVVDANLKTQVNKYTPDGRLKTKSDNIQESEGGAYTAEVGNGEFNFLMYKDLEAYLQEDAVWNKEEADRPMDSIQNSAEMGERANLGGDVKSYQPSQQVKINKQSEAY